eukprot:Gb_28612 [translate_table: standard]
MSTLCNKGRWKKVSNMLHLTSQGRTRGECKAYARLLQECVNTKALPQGKQAHARIIKTGFETVTFLQTHLVNMYAKCEKIAPSRQVFEEMSERSVVSWTAIIAGYVQNGHCEEALKLFLEMQRELIEPNEFTYPCVLRACAGLESVSQGKQVHTRIIKTSFDSDVFVSSALLYMYAKCGCRTDARQVFDKMPSRNIVSWNAMIAGCVLNGRAQEGLQIFEQLRWASIQPNYITFCSVLNACVDVSALEQGKQLHAHIIKSGFESDVTVGNALIDLYGKGGSVKCARSLFEKLLERNGVSWSSIIAAYAQNGWGEDALNIFWQVHQEGVHASEHTFSSVLSACAGLAGLDQGKQVHSQIFKTGFDSDVFVGSALVDMYGKSGNINDACQVFNEMPERNVVSWNAMIAGCAQHGRGNEALQLFEQMQCDGIEPNYITFVCVLSACSHAGLVEKGRFYFDSMNRHHGIIPGAEHYACMVDLLGRAGCLDEAEEFIKETPFEPTASMWGALLGACRVHGNMELGKRAAEHVFELDPQDSGTHVLLSNIYAAGGRWDDVAKVRNMMKNIGMKKEPGCSWIEVRNRVHAFHAKDQSHPKTEEIYALLESLSGKMKEAGYVPDTNFVLLDVEEQHKEHLLCYHSEKLALAFGLISIPPGIPIRITKNLRMCGDCHTSLKFISNIVGREIVVRDTNRFHHFKGSLCTCGDYW